MAWLRVDDRVRTHPKLVQAGPEASWFWFCGICYSREHLTDGFIPAGILPSLAPGVRNGKALAAKLVGVNLWHAAEGGYQIHDFLDWNPSRADVQAQRRADAERKAASKGGARKDSERIPAGKNPDSEHTRDAHAGLGSGSNGSSSENAQSGGRQIVSPAEFERLKRFNRFVGARLRVPHKLHGDLVAQLGGTSPEAALLTWYGEVDAEIETSGEAILPDIWKWLDARFKRWAMSRQPAVSDGYRPASEWIEQNRKASEGSCSPEEARAILAEARAKMRPVTHG